MESLSQKVKPLNVQEAIRNFDGVVYPIARRTQEKLNKRRENNNYSDEDDYEAYPDFDYTEDI